LIVVLGLCGCGADEEAPPPPVGSGSAGSGSAGSTVGSLTTRGDSSGSTSDATTSGSDTTDGVHSGTGAPVETGSETPCGDWAEVYVGCIGSEMPLSDLEQQCDAVLAGWEEPLPSCRVLAEELLVCTTHQPCQAFIDWERNRAIPPECEPELAALEQMCSFIGTTST
jgi:hypothetical protein